jgi:predicted negative regulator of RcsB-dependent stress response
MTQSYLAAQDAFEDELEAYQKQLENLQSIELAKDLRPDHGKSTPLFKEFADKYASHPLGWQAALRVAQESIKDKNFDEAISRLEPILPKTRSFPIMQVKIRDTLAGLYAEKGDFAKALAEIRIIEEISENPAPDQTLLRKAQFLYLSGDKDAARQLLEQIAEGRVGERVVASDVSLEASTWVDFWDLKP